MAHRDAASRQNAFDAFLDAGREGRPSGWRFAASLATVIVLYIVATLALAIGVGGLFPTVARGLFSDANALTSPGSFEASLVLLAIALGGLAMTIPALAIALRLFHRRRLSSIFGAERRIRLGAVAVGMAAAAATSLVSLPIAMGLGTVELEYQTPPPGWLLFAAAIALLVVFQASAEELVFRGYMLQWIGSRLRTPFAWALIPSVAFGLLHYSGGDGSSVWAYVAVTLAFGLFAAALVWRTGGLSHAIGFHIANNWIALLAFESPVGVTGVGLFKVHVDESDLPIMLATNAALFAVVYLVMTPFLTVETPRADPRAAQKIDPEKDQEMDEESAQKDAQPPTAT